MSFKETMLRAKEGSTEAEEEILLLYKPLLLKESIQDGIFDEDLYQELCITLVRCVRKFRL